MKKTLLLVISVVLLVSGLSLAEAITPEEIVKEADRARGPEESFRFDLTITSLKPDREDEVSKFEVLVKGRDKSLVKFTYPRRDRGKVMLMVGNNLWIYIPTSRNPIRISQQQRLMGQVSNGDVARANFAEDYLPTLLREEELEGVPSYVLELNAKTKGVTYHKIIYWVKKDSFNPVKSEFYTISGKLLKTAYYEGYEELLGRERVTRMVIVDELRDGQSSIMQYSNTTIEEFPDRIFQKDYLKHLR